MCKVALHAFTPRGVLQGALRPSPLASVCESAEAVAEDDDQADTVSEGGRRGGRRGSATGTETGSSPSLGVTFDSAATLADEEHNSRPKFKPQVRSAPLFLLTGLRRALLTVVVVPPPCCRLPAPGGRA